VALQLETLNGTPTHPDCAEAARAAAALCESLGHQVEEARFSPDAQAFAQATTTIIAANLRATLEDRAAALGRELREQDVEPGTWRIAAMARDRSAEDYLRAVQTLHALGRQLGAFLSRFDVLLTPTLATPPPPLGLLSLSNPNPAEQLPALLQAVGFTQLANATGSPAMSVPLHWNAEGLPIGVMFTGRHSDEATLFRLAAQLEEARPWFQRRPPLCTRSPT